MSFVHFRYFGKFSTEGGEFSDLLLLIKMIAHFPLFGLESVWLAVSSMLILLTGKEFHSILEGSLRRNLIDSGVEALLSKSVEVMH